MNIIDAGAKMLRDRLLLLVGAIALARMIAAPFHVIIISAFGSTILVIPILLVGFIFYTLAIFAFRSYFKLMYKNFAPYIHKDKFNLSVIFGIVFFVLPLPTLALMSIFVHFLDSQLAIGVLLIIRLALIYGAIIAHCILLAVSLKDLISEHLRNCFKVCAGLVVLCFLISLRIVTASFGRIHSDGYLDSVIIDSMAAEFWVLFCVVPYCAVLVIAFWNLPKRLTDEDQSQGEIQRDEFDLSMFSVAGSNTSEEQRVS